MIPFDNTPNLILPIPNKKIVKSAGINLSVNSLSIGTNDFFPSLAGTDSIYFFDYVHQFLIAVAGAQNVNFNVMSFDELISTIYNVNFVNPDPRNFSINNIFSKIIQLQVTVADPVGIYIQGYRLDLEDI